MLDMLNSFFGEELTLLAQTNVLFLILTAFVCGALVGLEREKAEKPAGLRTNILICVGSTLFTLASIFSWQLAGGENSPSDPGRIAAQIVSGVGFLGAGAILRIGMNITGLTTAATIWLVAAIGVLIGLGFPLLGFLISLLVTITLFILGRVELLSFPRTDKEEKE